MNHSPVDGRNTAMSVFPSPSKSPRRLVENDCGKSNRATQLSAVVIVTLPSRQSASPLQPPNVDPGAGVAVSVKTCPGVNVVVHVVPQSIPVGLLDTVPLPVPDLVKVSAGAFTV